MFRTPGSRAVKAPVKGLIEATAALGSVPLTIATPANIASISLPAGNWDVSGTVAYSPALTTIFTLLQAGTNTISATVDATPGHFGEVSSSGTVTSGNVVTVSPGQPRRYSLSVATTVFLTTNQVFTVSTMTAGGKIKAVKML